jgi:hypothetical protein
VIRYVLNKNGTFRIIARALLDMVCAHQKGTWMKEVFLTSAIPGSKKW